ncbi:MAG: patatin-like phospholipase family protein [Ignavibacteriales bacterium]
MELANTGLVLEGGGMRGVYTSGILQYFMEKELYFPYVIGVSMGACNAANYVSRQPGRNRIVNIKYVNDRRYLSYMRLLLKCELFGMDFIFNTIPNKLEPFDYETFRANRTKCITTVTDCHTGEALYFEKDETGDDYLKVLQASSSLPFISRPVRYKGKVIMDGGMSDSIPVRKSMADGNLRNVIILTQPKGYRKKPESLARFTKLRYPGFKGLDKALKERHIRYNETIDFIERLSDEGSVFIMRPGSKLNSGRIETDKSVLNAVYEQGYKDAADKFTELLDFLKQPPTHPYRA